MILNKWLYATAAAIQSLFITLLFINWKCSKLAKKFLSYEIVESEKNRWDQHRDFLYHTHTFTHIDSLFSLLLLSTIYTDDDDDDDSNDDDDYNNDDDYDEYLLVYHYNDHHYSMLHRSKHWTLKHFFFLVLNIEIESNFWLILFVCTGNELKINIGVCLFVWTVIKFWIFFSINQSINQKKRTKLLCNHYSLIIQIN